MAITFIQEVFGVNGGNTFHITPIAASGMGNLIIVLITGSPETNSVSNIIDNVGNFYSLVPNTKASETGPGFIEIWYAANTIAGATSVTTTYANSCGGSIIVAEYSGVALMSPVDIGVNLVSSGGSASLGPSFSITNTGDLLVTRINKDSVDVVGVNPPWNIKGASAAYYVDLIAPGSTGPFQAVFTPAQTDSFVSASAAFFPISPPLMLTLSDTQASSDSRVDEVEKVLSDTQASNDTLRINNAINASLSDNTSISDTAPQSFSIRSNSVAQVSTPVFETLTNNLIPANVKAYYKIEE